MIAGAIVAGVIFASVLVFGDAAVAAAVAGAFSVLNTALTAILLRWVNGQRREQRTIATSAANAAVAAQGAAEASLEAARVAKAIGANLRHEDTLAIVRPPKPELPQ